MGGIDEDVALDGTNGSKISRWVILNRGSLVGKGKRSLDLALGIVEDLSTGIRGRITEVRGYPKADFR